MLKFTTRDGKNIKIDVPADNEQLANALTDIIPRLSYDEILDGDLEKRLGKEGIGQVKLSSSDDVKQLIFSLAMFNTLSKPTGV